MHRQCQCQRQTTAAGQGDAPTKGWNQPGGQKGSDRSANRRSEITAKTPKCTRTKEGTRTRRKPGRSLELENDVPNTRTGVIHAAALAIEDHCGARAQVVGRPFQRWSRGILRARKCSPSLHCLCCQLI